ncbi:MAG: DUF885 domain-containing protein [Thermoanaerobaculia bacterium]|nr:DUF885 domain-containing protein [Thermoanaerobaculia bacterium]
MKSLPFLPSSVALLAVLLLPSAPAEPAAADPAEALHDLFGREWEDRLERNPRLATSVGRHEYDDRLESVALDALTAEVAQTRSFLAELNEIPFEALSTEDRINYQIFRTQLEGRIRDFEFGAYQIPFNADSGFHIGISRLPADMPLATVSDYENYLARLEALPTLFEEHIANMRRGIERGMTLPRAVLDGYDVTMSAHVVTRPEESVFFEPFESFASTVPEGERQRLTAAGRRAVTGPVAAAYRELLAFFVDEYLPAARHTLAASRLPDGEAYYAWRIEHFTTLPLGAAEIHRIGLEEVERIRSEMQQIIDRVGFDGSFAEFLEFLRTDPRFYVDTPEALLKEAAWIAKRADAQLPRFFGRLPRLPYGVAPVPDHIAPKYTAGRYVSAPVGGTEPGYYWVNTYKLDSRSLYTLEALTLHEAVPGHHLQGALADEQDELPNFRRFSYLSAFGEGWGLYSEWLGQEMGFYTDPYSDFGRLTYEMWRACRLVVDTGVHAMDWTRQQMIDYLAAHTALSLHECTTETDRYISWPAQALAYKIGELEIRRLRRKAEEALGERFDVRRFHDVVLLNGAVPLPVLGEEIDRFIAAEGGATASDG